MGILTIDWLILRWWISWVRTVPARGWLTTERQTVPLAFSCRTENWVPTYPKVQKAALSALWDAAP